MAEYFSPGVYIEEYDNAPRSVEGVGTSTGGFIGLAEKGPTKGAPQLVTNFRNFQKQFGGFLSEYTHGEYRYLANAVEQFFVNGGTRCYVSRVAPEDAASASKKMGILTVTAANEGKWGNRIQISLKTVLKKKMQLLENTGKNSYKAKSVEGFREGDIVEFNGEYNRIAVIYDEQITFENKFKADPVDKEMIPKNVIRLVTFDMQIRYNDEVENFFDLTLNTSSPAFIGSRLAVSKLVNVEAKPVKEAAVKPEKAEKADKADKAEAADAVKEIGNPVEAILGKGITEGSFTLEGGFDGSIAKVNAGTFIGKDEGPLEHAPLLHAADGMRQFDVVDIDELMPCEQADAVITSAELDGGPEQPLHAAVVGQLGDKIAVILMGTIRALGIVIHFLQRDKVGLVSLDELP